ncbi:MAG: hypothetical protein KF773_25340 [Deltaproteobacteria bacterium]|nr:hypothetical protein [Deltaproteobacteria bacterium]
MKRKATARKSRTASGGAQAKKKAALRGRKPAKARKPPPHRWPAFVEKHGIVLASARGPVPSVAEAIAGEPIVGSWWSHPKAQEIFDALSTIDDDDDVRCFKLVDGKITFVHRRLWPALVVLARAGVVSRAAVESIQQEHMPTGEHRNFTTPFPDWVPEDVAAFADVLALEVAQRELGDRLRSRS